MDPSSLRQSVIDRFSTDYSLDMARVTEAIISIDLVTSIILGLVAYGIAIFMPLSTILDLMYITIPLFRGRMEKVKWARKKVSFSLVSKIAYKVVEETETFTSTKTPYGLYFLRRGKSYLIAFSVLGIIVAGAGPLKQFVIQIVAPLIVELG